MNDIFNNLPALSPDEYDELFNEFSSKINQESNLDETNTIESKPYTPIKIRTRLRLTRVLLSICALGTKFNEDVYSYTLDFVLRKELCLIPISLN